MTIAHLKVKLFADGADLAGIKEMAANPAIRGFTTNPTLMRKAGVSDYKAFALQALQVVGGRPISFEVFADEFGEMGKQAHEIASWGKNIYVKIPVTSTKGEFSGPLVERLTRAGISIGYMAEAIAYHRIDRSRLTEKYFKSVHKKQGQSRLVFKNRSVPHILFDLCRTAFQYAIDSLVAKDRRRYRSKGRIYHYLGMLEAKWNGRTDRS